jgi:hypothetical protein
MRSALDDVLVSYKHASMRIRWYWMFGRNGERRQRGIGDMRVRN